MQYRTPQEIAAEVRVCAKTVMNWIHGGYELPGGRRVKLAGERFGRVWRIHPDAWERFRREMNPEPKQRRRGRDREAAKAERRVRARLGMTP